MKLYQVQAYRYGQLNGHQYTVAIHTDKPRALHVAQAEVDDRAGKYGVAVYEWDDGVRLQDTYNRIGYYESSAQEGEPSYNHRIEARASIGSAVLHAFETSQNFTNAIPQWLLQKCETELKGIEIIQKSQEPNDDN